MSALTLEHSEPLAAPPDQQNRIIVNDTHQDVFDNIKGTVGNFTVENPKMRLSNVDVFYGDKQAIYDVSLDIANNEVIAMIGPSGCGKSTFLRCLNRMNDTIPTCRVSGDMFLDGEDLYGPDLDTVLLRARVGMVFQKPNPFAKSIYDNVAYGPRIHGLAPVYQVGNNNDFVLLAPLR